MNDNADRAAAHRPQHDEPGAEPLRDTDALLNELDMDDGRDSGRDAPQRLLARGDFREEPGEQVDFREQFDEDLYNDREEAPVQGNTADVAMGEQRFGSDAEAYAEYAHRRPGEDSAVGQSRDPADISDDDDELP